MKNQTRGESPLSATAGYASLVVDARVRYWEDAEINGVSDEEGDLIPLKEGDSWKPVIDLATGRIKDWPADKHADIHFKVCDDGDYWLANPEGEKLAKWRGNYVPDAFLCVGDRGYGDYIIMKVNCDGQIEGWNLPEIDAEEWEILQHNARCGGTAAQEPENQEEADRRLPRMTCSTSFEFSSRECWRVCIEGKEWWVAKDDGELMEPLNLPAGTLQYSDLRGAQSGHNTGEES